MKEFFSSIIDVLQNPQYCTSENDNLLLTFKIKQNIYSLFPPCDKRTFKLCVGKKSVSFAKHYNDIGSLVNFL